MQIENLIPVDQFCLYHQIDTSFVHSLNELGLVEITRLEQNHYICIEHTGAIEKMIRLHYGLGINMEGIDAVLHLLSKMEALQEELRVIKNRLNLYEHP